ncbi:hypothetical protein PAI11_44450 [Patulibacter medicamentivorans]|uniref:Uncharacterized protein n=1 Tax=Patulibacter medicamentivorans TaxID=1097667 RepID=H0EC67_9ACTN|nr:hypothetical protein [Patulibacter medicamentivorans]EHN08739.1 hypothetical protein PAI11_44450 [Patulibacter medicamentivorans]
MSRSLRDLSGQVDPLLAVVVGGVLVVGGGLAVWGSGQDTSPVANDPSAALTAAKDDATTARALQAVAAANRDSAVPATTEAAELRRARRASDSGRSTDPFSRGATAPPAAAGGGSSGSGTATSVSDKARSAVATSNAASSAAASATGTAPTTAVKPATPATSPPAIGGGSEQDRRKALAALAAQRAKLAPRVSMRVKTSSARDSRSRLKLGTLLPNSKHAVARIVDVSASGRVVTLRLDRGVTLPGPQSKGTVCVQRFTTGKRSCRLVHVRAGRTVVLRAPERRGEPGDVTALRILSVWRGTVRMTAR